VDDFCSLEIPPRHKILNPWICEQDIILISAWRGTGKTWFGISLFDAISRGQPFGPWQTETAVKTLYLDAEMASKDSQDRLNLLKKAARSPRKADFLYYSDALACSHNLPRVRLMDEEWREKFKAFLVDHEFKLLALDNIASLVPGSDENLKKDWDCINRWLIELRFNGIATVLFHHTGKDGSQRGTSGREDNVNTSIILDRPGDYMPEDGARFIVKFSKNRIFVKDISLLSDTEMRLQEVDGILQWSWSSAKAGKKVEILKAIHRGERQTRITEELDVTKGYVSRIRKEAFKDGFLSDAGKLTPRGVILVGSSSTEW
jgi:putative DNA primase/helicase